MRKIFLWLLVFRLFLLPAVSAFGESQGWIQIHCNVDGASVSFDGKYQGLISGGSLTVPVYITGSPFTSYTVEKTGYTSYTEALMMPGEGETKTFYATLNPTLPRSSTRQPILARSRSNHHPPGPRSILTGTIAALLPSPSMMSTREATRSVQN